MKILMVEDSEENRILLERILQKAGYSDLVCAADAQEAFERLKLDHPDGPDPTFDLVLMDILMPKVDGVTACGRIKRHPGLKDLPVIMVTAQNDIKSLKAAFDAGAMDYITKPFKKPELLARVRSALALKTETDLRKAKEIEIARIGSRIQGSLLRSHPPNDISNAQVSSMTLASQYIDGDFLDFYQPADHLLDILVADVMGKGLPAALLGVAVKTQFLRAHSRWRSRGFEKMDQEPPTPEEIVGMVHKDTARELVELETFITLCYARLNLKSGRVGLVDCGHVPTLHFLAKEKATQWIRGENLPMGVLPGEKIRAVNTSMAPGDLLLLYSDGLTEARDPDGRMFGPERLEHLVKQNADKNLDEMLDGLRERIKTFTNMSVLSDDLTCVAVKLSDGI